MKRRHLLVRNQSRSSGAPHFATLLLAVLLSCIGTKAFAYDFTAQNDDGVTIYYNYINDNKEVEVTHDGNYSSNLYSGDVTIPATVTAGDGTILNVTSIGQSAFQYCSVLTSVIIPDGVASIGNCAFYRCSNLTEVTIPKSVTSIGDEAFYGCTGLTSVIIPDGVVSIGLWAFNGCTSLTEVTLQGSTLPNFDDYVFDGISSNATLYCAPGLGTACSETEPWKSKFNTIDASVVTLASGERLSAYITDDNKSTVTKLKIYGEIKSEDITLMADMARSGALSVIDMSEATTTNTGLIGSSAFDGCSKLTSISLPKSITSIGKYAFYGTALTSVTISNSVTSIGDYAFAGCSKLESITIPNSVTSIDEGAFSECISLASIIIPNSVTSIGRGAFCYCTSLASVTIPNSVTNIGRGAFKGCINLASVSIGNSVTSIGDYAFYDCTSLTEVTLQGTTLPTTCATNAFDNISSNATLYCAPGLETTCSNTAPWSSFGSLYTLVTLAGGERLSAYITDDNKSTVTKLKIYGEINSKDIALMADMAKNSALSVIDMSEATAATEGLIGIFAFNGYNSKLTSISLPNGITSIGEDAFIDCSNLASVTIPNSVTSIGKEAFYRCSNLTEVTIPKSVTSIGEAVFYNCSSLASIEVEEGNDYYHMDGNCLIETASNKLIRGCNLSSIAIPNSVTSIGKYTFNGCSSLTSITIPNSVTSIGLEAFSGCTNLTSVTIPNSVTSIGGYAFLRCNSLASVTIPNSVKSIGESAFCYCESLTSVTIPNSVTSIGDYAFNGCSNLAEVTLQGTTLPTTCADNAFNNISSNATLYCRAALLEKCQETEPWKNFNIVVKSFSVTISDAGIATGCFDDDLDFSGVTGVKAYIASGFNPETGKVLMTNVTEVPAGTGFLVKGEANTYEIPAAATKYMYANLLVGTLVETTVAQKTEDDSYTNYVLGKETDDVAGFYLANNSTVPANKAYLQLPTSAVTTGDTSDAKTSLRLSFDDMDDTTGITHVREQSDSANGKTVIYNLNGQRKQSLTKGLNIVNGKKIFVK